jgi:4-hydroxybenzoate polyprenyltransferase
MANVADTHKSTTSGVRAERAGRRVVARAWVRLLRPAQWSKNAVVLAPVVFARIATHPGAVTQAIVAMVAFCLISSAMYIFNDWEDIERDRHHPVKRFRPLALGTIHPRQALSVAVALACVSLVLAWAVTPALSGILAAYAALIIAYTFYLKRLIIIDVFAIAGGFLLRAVGGAVAVGVPISAWLMLCTVLLALFLGFCKRRNELVTLQASAALHRNALEGYTPLILDQFIVVTATSTILAYAMYTFTSITVPNDDSMVYTVPIVAFAMLRYLFLVYVRRLGGAPEVLLFRDPPLLGSILLWGMTVMLILWLR